MAWFLIGCQQPSPWERAYVGEPPAARAEDGAATPLVREVVWERVEGARRELAARAAASDVHPDDWTPEARAEAQAVLIRALQLPGEPTAYRVLGVAEFRTTDSVRADDGSLGEFGRRLGASHVVYSDRFVGKADRIVQEPVTTHTSGTESRRDVDGKRRSEPFSVTSTTWVPIRVSADETAYVAYFVKRMGWTAGAAGPGDGGR